MGMTLDEVRARSAKPSTVATGLTLDQVRSRRTSDTISSNEPEFTSPILMGAYKRGEEPGLIRKAAAWAIPDPLEKAAVSFKRGAQEFSSDIAYATASDPKTREAVMREQGRTQQEEAINPVYGNIISRQAYAVARMMPGMAAGAVGGVMAAGALPVTGAAALGGTAIWATQGMGSIRKELDEAGVDPDVAGPASLVGGLAYAAIETAQVGKVTKASQELLKRQIQASVKRWALEKGKDIGKNVTEEGMQDLVESISRRVAVHASNANKGTDIEQR